MSTASKKQNADKVPPTSEESNMIRLLLTLVLILTPHLADAQVPKDRAVLAIIGESENQGAKGMLLVACAIRNRGTLKGVYGEKAPRVVHHLYTRQIEDLAVMAWNVSASPENCTEIEGADHWENVKAFGTPKWADKMEITFMYKDHVFFREKK